MAPPWVKGPRESRPLAANPTNSPSHLPSTVNSVPSPQQPPKMNFVVQVPSPNKGPSIQNHAKSAPPTGLGALLQQAPLPALIPSSEISAVPPPSGSSEPASKPGLKGPITPKSGGPLAGAMFVLPPIPIRSVAKVSSGKSSSQLAKIKELRHSVRPRPEDIRGLLREIEGGARLRHVECDDRSKPLIRRCKTFFPEF